MRWLFALGLPLILSPAAALQDDSCSKFNRCKTSASKERVECPRCDKARIPSDYAFCARCAKEEEVCGRCGHGKPGATRPSGSGRIEDAVKSANAKSLREMLAYIASDELEGRCAGYPGNDKAAAYIRDNLKKWGFKPGNKGEWYQPFPLQDRRTQNVIGIIEGTDLRDEYVIAGGHYDHVGRTGQADAGRKKNDKEADDGIWNGADDNGSGTTTLLEIARCLGTTGIRGRRTIVMMWFSAEEFGLVGSKHYANKEPIFPLDKTVAMINMDMLGRNPDKPYSLGVSGKIEDWRALIAKCNEGVDCPVSIGSSKGSRTDQESFVLKNVPTAGFFSGFHPDYHCQSDHADKIAYDKMEKAAKLGIKMIYELATVDRTPAR
jgi:hypothetical protein